MRVLRLNDSGEDVLILQKLLQDHGLCIESTGVFDSQTHQGITSFQDKQQLSNDGVVGYQTWENLLFSNKEISTPTTKEDYRRVAYLLDIEPAVIRAVEEVETGGVGGFVALGKPPVLFEGHIFWDRLKRKGIDPELYVEGNEDILYPKWDKSFYKKGIEEYGRLERARKIDQEAADKSTSWGKFQIMGFNYAACGVNSIEEFLHLMCRSELDQLLLFTKFIYRQKRASFPDDPEKYLISALRAKDWANFARMYNGPLYSNNSYDIKLEAAYKKYSL